MTETVDVALKVLNPDRSVAKSFLFKNLAVPLQLRDIEKRLKQNGLVMAIEFLFLKSSAGYKPSYTYAVSPPEMDVEVSDGPSKYYLRRYGARIHM